VVSAWESVGEAPGQDPATGELVDHPGPFPACHGAGKQFLIWPPQVIHTAG
jgi:hypothetical protein